MTELPHDRIYETDGMYIYQQIDPLGARNTVLASSGSQDDGTPVATGSVDSLDDGKTFELFSCYRHSEDDQSDDSAVIGFVETQLYVFFTSENNNKIISVKLADANVYEEVKELVFIHTIHKEDGKNLHYFIVSRKTKSGKADTTVYIVKDTGSTAQLERSLKILDKFFEPKELAARLKEIRLADGRISMLAFDTVSPCKGPKAYKPKASDTLPLLNLTTTTNAGHPKQIYKTPLKAGSLGVEGLVYREFDPTGAIETKTGIYLERSQGSLQETKFFPGKLLVLPRSKGHHELYIDNLQIIREVAVNAYNDPMPNVDLKLFALDPRPGDNIKQFQALVHIGSLESQAFAAAPQIITFPVEADFKQLVGAKIIHGKRKHKNEITVLFFFRTLKKGEKTSRLPKGGVLATHFAIQIGVENLSPAFICPNPTTPFWLEREEVPGDSLKSRLIPDIHGHLYCVQTPALDTQNGHYAIRRLAQPETLIFPTRSEERIVLRPNESILDDKQDLSGLGTSRWYVFVENDLTRQISWLEQYVIEQRQTEKKPSLFPQLEKMLETLADLTEKPRRMVLLVEPALKNYFRSTILSRLLTNNEHGKWSLGWQNTGFRFYLYDPTAPKGEIKKELGKISNQEDPNKRDVLYVDLGELLKQQRADPKKEELIRADTVNAEEDAGEDDNDSKKDKPEKPDIKKDEQTETDDKEEDSEEAEEGEEKSNNLHGLSPEDLGISAEVTEAVGDVSELFLLATDGQCRDLDRFKSTGGVACKIPMLILATPDEWKAATQRYPHELEVDAHKSLELNSQFLTSPWYLWPPNTVRAKKEVKDLSAAPVSEDEQDVFPNLKDILTDIVSRQASAASQAKHRILIVPKELKELVKKLILGRWATSNKLLGGPGQWNYQNEDLALFELEKLIGDKQVTQNDVFDNLETMRGLAQASRNVAMIADLETVASLHRVLPRGAEQGKTGFKIRDKALQADGGLLGDSAQSPTDQEAQKLPHLLYLLATEGRKVQPSVLETPGSNGHNDVSMVLIGTEEELETIRRQADLEGRFGLESHFEQVKLEAPTKEIKLRLIQKVFERPQVKQQNYIFKFNRQNGETSAGYKGDTAKEQIIATIVNRIDTYAAINKIDQTTAFIRTYKELRRALVQDQTLRTNKMIDKSWVEQLLTRVFSIPINLENLPNNDPLQKLKNPTDAALALEQLGFHGLLENTPDFIPHILSQTRSTPGKKVPSSFILFGDTSVGKTFLFEKLIEYLDLKYYNFDKPQELEPWAFRINVDKIVDDNKEVLGNPEFITISKTLEHLSNFLSLPHGHRGFILLDDIHKAKSENILSKLVSFTESLLDAKDGILRVKRMGTGEIFEIPVRNIVLGWTINPTKDKQAQDRYGSASDSVEDQIVAAMARGETVKFEPSILARFGKIFHFPDFSIHSKVPALAQGARDMFKNDYLSSQGLRLVSTRVLNLISDQFPRLHAREFLQTATGGLAGLGAQFTKASALLILPKPEIILPSSDDDLDPKMASPSVAGKKSQSSIASFIQEATIVLPISDTDYRSQFEFLSFMLENFRLHLYEFLLETTKKDKRLSTSLEDRLNWVGPLLVAFVDHIKKKTQIPLSELSLQPQDFGLHAEDDPSRFLDELKKLPTPDSTFFPFPINLSRSDSIMSVSEFLGDEPVAPKARSRSDVFSETVEEILNLLRPVLASYFRLNSLDECVSPETWISRLQNEEPQKVFQAFSEKLTELYFRFIQKLHSRELLEKIRPNDIATIITYDEFRLFFTCLDRAVSLLPWGQMTHFMTKAILTGGQNTDLRESAPYINLLFESSLSPTCTMTTDMILAKARTLPSYEKLRKDTGDQLGENYDHKCERFLIPEAAKAEYENY
ncbi:MAG: hypothetical protein HY072_08560 [Deltaproteobacteria bacterium]|nr:hypothetical protein [Deltaproteobacteria bacterium]